MTSYENVAVAENAIDGTQDDGRNEREVLVEELRGRSRIYRLLYRLYYWPFSQDELDAIDIDELEELSHCEDAPLMAAGFNDMYRHLRRRHTGTREELNADFTRSFMGGATYKGLACQPYASLFISDKGQIMGEPRNRARATYKRHRVKLADGVDLPEDHLSFECEFMAVLGERAADALEAGRSREAAELLDEQQAFLSQQMLTWTDRFFNLSAELVRSRFYRGVVRMTKGFLDSEAATIRQQVEAVEELRAA